MTPREVTNAAVNTLTWSLGILVGVAFYAFGFVAGFIGATAARGFADGVATGNKVETSLSETHG